MNYITLLGKRLGPVNCVQGTFSDLIIGGELYKPATFTRQKWVSDRRPIGGYGRGAWIEAKICFDDECRNGHNTFAITAEISAPRRSDLIACGCLHDKIARVFPELKPLIKWHSMSTNGPSHYIANTLYHARDRDAFGLEKERDLDAARRAAIWPDASDAELCAGRESLKAALEARLPALLESFRFHVASIGFLWEPPNEGGL